MLNSFIFLLSVAELLPYTGIFIFLKVSEYESETLTASTISCLSHIYFIY